MELVDPSAVTRDILTFLRQSSFDDIALIEELSANERGAHSDYSAIQHTETELMHIHKRRIVLPAPLTSRRGSATEFSHQLSPDTILQILANANSANHHQSERRPYSSAGAIYPIELFVGISPPVKSHILADGVYHQLPYSSQLEFVTDFKAEELSAAMNFGDSPFLLERLSVVFYALNIEKCVMKYGHRGLLFAAMDVGAICRNVEIEVSGVSGASRVWGGYRVAQLGNILNLDPSRLPIVATQLIGVER